MEENDPGLIAVVLGDIAKAQGMTSIAKKTGLGRESLYKAFSAEGHPEFSTALKVVEALGLQLQSNPAIQEGLAQKLIFQDLTLGTVQRVAIWCSSGL